ncbi:hypothetical protein K443DRAFT_507097 [Laccaria amethystina LaAM-08-1]|uniref:Uncharacterized protein n=1 Tax=Laccaria amethystina LaAM-08-1 TaxID=1095629 RepID=A0A0C9WSS5_9AGAR|nr:hypothetical protein K443DRAFT_507097 [Laccaria amethystina LaAM-08-1]
MLSPFRELESVSLLRSRFGVPLLENKANTGVERTLSLSSELSFRGNGLAEAMASVTYGIQAVRVPSGSFNFVLLITFRRPVGQTATHLSPSTTLK